MRFLKVIEYFSEEPKSWFVDRIHKKTTGYLNQFARFQEVEVLIDLRQYAGIAYCSFFRVCEAHDRMTGQNTGAQHRRSDA